MSCIKKNSFIKSSFPINIIYTDASINIYEKENSFIRIAKNKEELKEEILTKKKLFKSIDKINNSPIPYSVVEKIPFFDKCSKLSKDKIKICNDDFIKNFILSHLLEIEYYQNVDKLRIMYSFLISKEGIIYDISVRTNHKELESEFKKIIKLLPNFNPGIKNNEEVTVRYSSVIKK